MPGLDSLVLGRLNWLRLPELRLGEGGVVDFLHDHVARGEVLLHGSNSRTIERFEPRDQTSYHGVPVRAVFATPDPRHFFSVGANPSEVWCPGAVYLLPRAAFLPSDEPSGWVAMRGRDLRLLRAALTPRGRATRSG
jgi:hypothetical protein